MAGFSERVPGENCECHHDESTAEKRCNGRDDAED